MDPSMVELVLAAVPPAERVSREAAALAERLGALDAAPDLSARLAAFVHVIRWTRTWRGLLPPVHPDKSLPEAALSRIHHLLDLLERAPEVRTRVQRTVGRILAESDALVLFAEAGIPAQHGFFAEFGDRLMNKLLPQPRDDRDLAKLLRQLFDGNVEVERFLQMPPDELLRLARMLMPPTGDAAWAGIRAAFADAFRLLAARIQAEGLSAKLRTRSRPGERVAVPSARPGQRCVPGCLVRRGKTGRRRPTNGASPAPPAVMEWPKSIIGLKARGSARGSCSAWRCWSGVCGAWNR
jgi:hypothetical protein